MLTIFRYRNPKPPDGHLSFMLPEGATILAFVEHWHTKNGWEVYVDVYEDTHRPRERRWFFLCNAGDNLTALGENGDVYFVGKQESKSYVSYLLETTHMSDTERQQLKVHPSRFVRSRPAPEELSVTDRRRMEQERRERQEART